MPRVHYSVTLEKDLFFDEKRHRYYYKGEPVPGVTTVISSQSPQVWMKPWVAKMICNFLEEHLAPGVALTIQEKNELITAARGAADRVSKEAADVGSMAHAWIEGHIKLKLGQGEAIDLPDDPRAVNAINAFLAWESANSVKYLGSEMRLYSFKRRVAGTLDVLAEVNGKVAVIDNKTANGIYSEHFIQTTGYADILEEMWEPKDFKVEEAHVIRLGKEDGEFHHQIVPDGGLRDFFVQKFNMCAEGYYLDKEINTRMRAETNGAKATDSVRVRPARKSPAAAH